MKYAWKMLSAAIMVVGFSGSASAEQMCPSGVYFGGECISVSDYISGNVGAITNGATGVGESPKAGGPRPTLPRIDLAMDMSNVVALERDRNFLRAREAFDVRAMVAILGRTSLVLSPGPSNLRPYCKPPIGNLTWGYTVVTINGHMQGTYGWVCTPILRGPNGVDPK